jgi:NADH-quinone oxidoreductase subunit M
MANDMFLFFVFWEAMLVPMYLLIGIWGGPRKLYAAIKFFLYTLFGSVLMLLGILFLYFHHHTLTGVYTFYLPDLYATAPKIGGHAAIWLFFAFFLGFAIKVPMFPFHTWLPDAHVEAPTAGSVILAGVLLKMGTYGMIRFSLPFFPAVAMTPWVRQLMITLSLIGIIYGALVSLMQKDMKKLVAYSSVSHLGFCTLGIFALSPLGLSGSVLQQINHGISTGALFLIVGILYERRHTREISEYGGISNVMPVYATITLIMFMSSMGLPLLNGFVGEFTILQGTFMENKIWAAWAVPGIILAAAYLLWLYQRVFFGKVENPKNEKLLDLSGRELATLIPLVIIAFWIGLYPKPFFQILSTPVNNLVATVRPDYPGLNANKPVLATQPVAPAEVPTTAPIADTTNRRSLRSGAQKQGASGRDDNSKLAEASNGSTARVDRAFRPASSVSDSNAKLLQPAIPASKATNRRSLRSGAQKTVASGRDDNHVIGTHAYAQDDNSILGAASSTTATLALAGSK